MKMQHVEQNNHKTERELQLIKHRITKKGQVSQCRDILHQIKIHQNHQSAAQETNQRQMKKKPQSLQNVIMIQLGYQTERGKN